MQQQRIYFENLDGWRFLCVLFVFLFHSFHTEVPEILNSSTYEFVKFDIFGNGNLGVNFFFVLSGFLITYLLISEKKIRGQIDIKNFWIRRVLRIWPLFFFCVAFGFVVFPQLKLLAGQTPNETANPWYYITFLNNFDMIRNGHPDASILGVLWSIAIEEQFYLIWPIILFVFPIKRYWIPFVFILIASLAFRTFNDGKFINEMHTLSCIGDLTIGAIAAWLISEFNGFKTRIENLPKIAIVLIYTMFFGIFFFRDELLYANHTIRIVERMFIAVIIALIILEQNYGKHSLFKMSRFKQITSLGQISYSMYCLQFIGILAALQLTSRLGLNQELWQVLILETIIALTITIVISKMSYRYFERPFLKLKNRFSYITKE